jgi:MoxR-like ATPase
MVLGGKARALLRGRSHVSFDDVRALARPVLRHRLLRTFQAQSERVSTDTIVARILESVPPPRSGL